MQRLLSTVFCATLLAIASAGQLQAEGPNYTDFKKSNHLVRLGAITFDRDGIEVVVSGDMNEARDQFSIDELVFGDKQVTTGSQTIFDSLAISINDRQIEYSQITDFKIIDHEDEVTISFYLRKTSTRRLARIKAGNRIAFVEDFVIDSSDFVRGSIFTVLGDITVFGEVNGDIISLFGNVELRPGAVARGDVVTISGKIKAAKDASVYGELYTRKGSRTHRQLRRSGEISPLTRFVYNRVDGATVYAALNFHDPDSAAPTLRANLGYAFESERLRFSLRLEQMVWRNPDISFGGLVYRQLQSEDNWLLSYSENTAFALLATEDYMDYFEAEGAELFVLMRPASRVQIRVSFEHQETNWLGATQHLWSLFGGDKLFTPNFSRVDPVFRLQGISDIDTSVNGTMNLSSDYDTHDSNDPFSRSAWHLSANLEWSHPSFGSDFDYRRYVINLRRYQKINAYDIVLGRFVFGNSDGYLPMHKRYFIGGLGTLRGYRHKELMGTRFWMANVEFRQRFGRADFAASIFWDAAQIADDAALDGDVKVKQSVGIAAYFGSDIRFSLAKRLDRSFDDKLQINVRMAHVF